jgi:acyl dehydratase
MRKPKFSDSKYFEDFKIGEQFYIPSRTVSESHFAAFQLASGDNHPLHYDREYCRELGYPDLMAHGYQMLMLTAPGAGDFPYVCEASLIAFIEQSSKFLKPVFLGDTLYPELTVRSLKPGNTTGVVTLSSTIYNQRNELCMVGEMKFLIKKRNRQV